MEVSRELFMMHAMIQLRAHPQPMMQHIGNEREGYQEVVYWYERTPEECSTEALKLWKEYSKT